MENKISVIVTIYNTPEKYLRKCLDSIINQTLKQIEIILVNDGSNEDTTKICEEYRKKDNRINLINQSNGGESVARNVGIQNATTENITFVDSDDYIELNLCEKLAKYMEEINNEYDIIIFNCYVDYKNKKVKNQFYTRQGLLDKQDIEQIQLQNIEKGITKYYPPESNISVPWAKVYNKQFIKQNNLKYIKNIIRMTDAIFNLEAFEKAKKIYMLDDYLYHYNQNEFSVCQKYSKDTISYYETYFGYAKKYIEKYNKNQKFIDTLNIKISTSIDKYMYNYYFNKDNPNNYKKIKEEFSNLLKRDLYKNAMSNVKMEYLSTYQKLVVSSAKKNNIFKLKILNKIKQTLKKLEGKATHK